MMDAKELDAHRSPIPSREVWVVSAWILGRAWPEVVSFAHGHLLSLALEGKVVTVELEADGERRRHEWQFDTLSDAVGSYGRLAFLIAPAWEDRPLGSYGSIRTRPSETTAPVPTPVEVGQVGGEAWVTQVARWQEQLGHVAHDQLCTIKASDLKVLIDEARTLHAQQLEAADLEPPTHARRLSNGKLRLLFGAPAVNLGDVVEVDVDELERERWRRMPVLPDHIQVARGEYNDLLRLRNVLADFASSVGDSTIGRMIAAHVNNPTSIIKLEEIR